MNQGFMRRGPPPALVDSVVADVMEHETKLLSRLDPGEQETLIRLLRKLLGEFE